MKKLFIILVVVAIFVGCKAEKTVKNEIQTDGVSIIMSDDAKGQITTNGNSIIMENTSGNIDVYFNNTDKFSVNYKNNTGKIELNISK